MKNEVGVVNKYKENLRSINQKANKKINKLQRFGKCIVQNQFDRTQVLDPLCSLITARTRNIN